MFYANDETGRRVFIDDANRNNHYFCPACGTKMIMRCGDIIAHHFSHKAHKNCDPWYTDKMSAWHRDFQSLFPSECQEVIVWNADHTEFHIADVLYRSEKTINVIEFQHSQLSRREFIERSVFYLDLGYKLFWVFDFRDPDHYKKILYTEKDDTDRYISLVWPGKDRPRFLDGLDRYEYADRGNFHILFHISTGLGEEVEHSNDNGFEWSTWEYVNVFSRETLFVEPRSMYIEDLKEFDAICYDEEEFYEMLDRQAKIAKKNVKCVNNST